MINLPIIFFSIKMYIHLTQTLITVFKERSFWKQRSGETSQICWSSVIVSLPNKNRCINFVQVYQRRYGNKMIKLIGYFIQRFYENYTVHVPLDIRLRLSLWKFPATPILMTTSFDMKLFFCSLLNCIFSTRDLQSLIRL